MSSEGSQAEFINLFVDEVLSKYSVNFQSLVININKIAREGLNEGTRIDAVTAD